MEWVIAAKTFVNPATLVNSSRRFTKTENYVAVLHIKAKNEFAVNDFVINREFIYVDSGKIFYNSVCTDRGAACVLCNHLISLLCNEIITSV